MQLIKPDTKIDFLSYTRVLGAVSAVVVSLSAIADVVEVIITAFPVLNLVY